MWGEYLFGLFESFLFFDFLSGILRKKDKVNAFIIGIFIFLYSIIILYSTNIIYFSNLKMIIIIFSGLLFTTIIYENSLKNKLIFTMIFFIVLILSDIFVANIMSVIMEISIIEIITENQWIRLLMFCGSKIIVFIILKIIVHFTNKNNIEIPIKYWYTIISTAIISIIILMIIGEIGFNVPAYLNKSSYFIAASVGILIINIIIYDTFIQLGKYFEKEKIYNIIDIKNEIMQEYYMEKDEDYNETRKLIHDFQNHILCISFLMKDNKFTAAKEYIDSIKEAAYSLDGLIRSGNHIVDAVLNQKSSYCEKLNINFQVNIILVDEIIIKPIDLCAILSNLIDNAIEATVKIKDKKDKNIKVKINEYKNYLLISISNNSKSNPLIGLQKFKTTKPNSKNHGLGIKIVENAVNKYNGSIEYNWEQEIFTVKILLKLRD